MTFNKVFLPFVVLLVAPSAMKVNARVCYIGDEASSIKGEPLLKLLPDQNPCECTEFRPGGVNTKRQAKPREVTFGNDGHPQGWTDKDCVKERQTTYTSPPCDTYSLNSKQGLAFPPYGQSFQSYPVKLEFTLQSSTKDRVEIDSFNIQNIYQCTFELDGNLDQMRIKKDGIITQTKDFQDVFDGSTHYWVTISQYKLEFGRLGEANAVLEYQSINEKITRCSLWTQSGTTLVLYGTCPPDVSIFSTN
ncbi:uncharacterized protein LOC117301483 [Asterias rubens]|uniref:uncharacterized protein LOC117301483 n=1 Tax=Asterias rubens TaxID=7604 RepID=UPI0014556062|nr:uncharacterized protein LOC117301483 [Asterias rubens]